MAIEPAEPNYRRLYLIAERERGRLLLEAVDRTRDILLGFAMVAISGGMVGFLLGWWLL